MTDKKRTAKDDPQAILDDELFRQFLVQWLTLVDWFTGLRYKPPKLVMLIQHMNDAVLPYTDILKDKADQ